MHIKPKDGIRVRNPVDFRIVPPDGIEVPDHDLFWHRLVNDGDFETTTTTTLKMEDGDAR